MNKENLIDRIEMLKERLSEEVYQAFDTNGTNFGNQRFEAFKRVLTRFINENLPSETSNMNTALFSFGFSYNRYETDGNNFWRNQGEKIYAYLDSLLIDIKNNEFEFRTPPIQDEPVVTEKTVSIDMKKVFIVHGHNQEIKIRTARFVEKLGFEAIILHEQASRGNTIIEKIEHYSNVGFAIILYTPDDMGNDVNNAKEGNLKNRARQNVVFEHGFLISKIGRSNVVALVIEGVELPNDISGVVYVSDKDWQIDIAKEMKTAGYDIDFNKLM